MCQEFQTHTVGADQGSKPIKIYNCKRDPQVTKSMVRVTPPTIFLQTVKRERGGNIVAHARGETVFKS